MSDKITKEEAINKAAQNFHDAAKLYHENAKEIDSSLDTMKVTLKNAHVLAKPNDKLEVMALIKKVNDLVNQAKAGGNKEKIIAQIKALQNK